MFVRSFSFSTALITALIAFAPHAAVAASTPAVSAAAGNFTEVPTLKQLGIANKVEKKTFEWAGDKSAWTPLDAYVLSVRLGKLSQKNFDVLKARYGGLSEIAYDPAREYVLTDFLSPLIQALDQKQFVPVDEKIKWPAFDSIVDDGSVEIQDLLGWVGDDMPAQVFTNCWGTTIAVARDIHFKSRQIELGWLTRGLVDERLAGTDNFVEIKADQVKFGDIMLIRAYDENVGDTMVQHAAVVIEPGLVFEKTDGTADDAFRLSYGADVVKKMSQIFDPSAKMTASYYRLKPGGKIPSMSESDTAIDYADIYGAYIPSSELARLIIGIEFDPLSGKPKAMISGLRPVGLLKDGKSLRYMLDPMNPYFAKFRTPAFN